MGIELSKLAETFEEPVATSLPEIELVPDLSGWEFVSFILHSSAASCEGDSRPLLRELAAAVLQAVFVEQDHTQELILPGERPAAAVRFLEFLCNRGFLLEGTSVHGLNVLFGTQSVFVSDPRCTALETAILGEDSLKVWLLENPQNRLELWEAIMPGKPFPECVEGAGENVEAVNTSSNKRSDLKRVCGGKSIANDLGNWDGKRKERYWNFLPKTATWLSDTENVKKLLPNDRKRRGERAINKHLQETYDFKLSGKTLKKYQFIK